MIATLLLALDAVEVQYFLYGALLAGLPLTAIFIYRLRLKKAKSSESELFKRPAERGH